MNRSKAKVAAEKKTAHRKNQARARKRKAATKGSPMTNALAFVVPAEPEESAHFLTGLAQAKGLDIGALLGPLLAPLLAGGKVDFGQLLKSPAFLAAVIPLLLGLLKQASGGGAGVPGELPTVPPPTVPNTTAPDEGEDNTPASGERSFAGLKGSYGNFQHGKSGGGVRSDPERGNEVFKAGANIFGPEKTKFIAYLTPLMSDGQGLQPGDDENDDIEVDYYGLEFDGKEYIGDAMMELGDTGILINNMDSSFGMNPRVVIDGMSGEHTFAVLAGVNGHKWRGTTLNVKGQKY